MSGRDENNQDGSRNVPWCGIRVEAKTPLGRMTANVGLVYR